MQLLLHQRGFDKGGLPIKVWIASTVRSTFVHCLLHKERSAGSLKWLQPAFAVKNQLIESGLHVATDFMNGRRIRRVLAMDGA